MPRQQPRSSARKPPLRGENRSGEQWHSKFEGDINGRVYQAGRNIDIKEQYDLDIDPIDFSVDPIDELVQGRGLGRLLMAVGFLVALAGFAGWMYLIFSGGGSGNGETAGDPFGTEAIVAFAAFGLGGVLASLGKSVSKAARERERRRERMRAAGWGRRA